MRRATAAVFAAVIAGIGCGGGVVTGTGGGSGTGGQSAGSPCPATEPSSGVACSIPNFACTYGDSVRPECRDQWTCTGGVWTPAGASCANPPTSACGSSEPTGGAMCGDDGAVCTYGNDICICSACGLGPCMVNAVWSCAKPPTGAGCPPIAPNAGTACAAPAADCTYGFPCGAAGTHVTCKDGLWTWDEAIACPL